MKNNLKNYTKHLNFLLLEIRLISLQHLYKLINSKHNDNELFTNLRLTAENRGSVRFGLSKLGFGTALRCTSYTEVCKGLFLGKFEAEKLNK